MNDSGDLQIRNLAVDYGTASVVRDFSLDVLAGQMTVICGPNGCGKSTALKAIRGLIPRKSGQLKIGNKDLSRLSAKELARHIAMLGQSPSAPAEMLVRDLVGLGRYAHRNLFQAMSAADHLVVTNAMEESDIASLADRTLGSLSGGQRQRAWFAMVLAQYAPIVFLDEPTNHLDISHALTAMETATRLTRENGRGLLVVLHDLNLAAAYADRIVLMKAGMIAGSGTAEEILTADLVGEVFDIDCRILTRPDKNRPLVIPIARAAMSAY